jgi:hypothetical protein
MIEYRRGKVRIIDCEALEEGACGCYPIIRNIVDGMYEGAAQTPGALGRNGNSRNN